MRHIPATTNFDRDMYMYIHVHTCTFHPFNRIASARSEYRCRFRALAFPRFSSHGHVNSTRRTTLEDPDQIRISGRRGVSIMSGGPTKGHSGKSKSTIQSLASCKIVDRSLNFFVPDFRACPSFTNPIGEQDAPTVHVRL